MSKLPQWEFGGEQQTPLEKEAFPPRSIISQKADGILEAAGCPGTQSPPSTTPPPRPDLEGTLALRPGEARGVCVRWGRGTGPRCVGSDHVCSG